MTTNLLLADPGWEEWVRGLMLEVIAGANAKGFKVDKSLANEQIEKTRVMAAYKPSTLIDFERGQELELESLFLEPLRQARMAGVEAPRLMRLCEILSALSHVS